MPLAQASKRAYALIESILKEMQRGIRDPSRLKHPDWELLFGAKQGVVANLQKLVQALSALPVEAASGTDAKPILADETPLSAEEMQLLIAWLEDRNPPD